MPTGSSIAPMAINRSMRKAISGVSPASPAGGCAAVSNSRRANDRIAGLRQTRASLATLRRGLDRMTPDSEQVAGLAPCECVEMVGRLPRADS